MVARGLLDAGMEVIFTGLRRTPDQIASAAVDEDVDVVGVSILSGAHMVLLPRIRAQLDALGGSDIRIIAGGVIPQEDLPTLETAGISRVFLSGTSIQEIVDYLRQTIPGHVA